MALGLCCQWIEPVTKRDGSVEWKNISGERALRLGRWREGKYSREEVLALYEGNARALTRFLDHVARRGIRLFRLSSEIFPLWDHCGELARESPTVRRELLRAGDIARARGIRVTTHPGQFCVLSSERESVVLNAIGELEYHAWTFDAMGLPRSPHAAINIHGGKAGRESALIDRIRDLSPGVRSRLTLENDENCYSLRELLPVHEATGVPIVWDSHHHGFRTGDLSLAEADRLSRETWSSTGAKPLQHLSNTEPGREGGSKSERRKHSWEIHWVPEPQLEGLMADEIDVDVEAKAKNLAIFKLVENMKIPL